MARYFGTNIISGDLPTFTQAQIDAINSGISSTVIGLYNNHISDSSVHVSTNDRTSWNDAVHKTGIETITGYKTFNAQPQMRNNLTPSTIDTKSSVIEDELIDVSQNVNGEIDGMNVIRLQNTDGSREVRYRAGFRNSDNSTNLWPAVSVGVKPDNTTYVNLNVNNAYSPTPSATDLISGTNIATTGWVNDASKSTNVVHKDTDEIITGKKTFAGGQATYFKDNNNTIGTFASDTWSTSNLYFTDNANTRIARIQPSYITGTNILKMGMYASNGNTTEQGITVRNDGVTSAPTPTASNSTSETKIATTGWVNDYTKSTKVVHREGSEQIAGDKRFTGDIIRKKLEFSRTGTYTADQIVPYRFQDQDNKQVGEIAVKKGSDGNIRMEFHTCIDDGNGGDVWKQLFKGYYDTSDSKIHVYLPSEVHGTNFYGVSTKSNWADLAECYLTDQKYPVGTLIKFGGEKDITIANINCNGVISDKPGLLLDSELEDSQPIALVGKTPIRILGKVKKFDRIVLDPENPGIGKVQVTSNEKVIAIALEDSNLEEEKLVKCVTKFNLD